MTAVLRSEVLIQKGERMAVLAELRSSRYVTSMPVAAMAASLVNRGYPCSEKGARRAREERGEFTFT